MNQNNGLQEPKAMVDSRSDLTGFADKQEESWASVGSRRASVKCSCDMTTMEKDHVASLRH